MRNPDNEVGIPFLISISWTFRRLAATAQLEKFWNRILTRNLFGFDSSNTWDIKFFIIILGADCSVPGSCGKNPSISSWTAGPVPQAAALTYPLPRAWRWWGWQSLGRMGVVEGIAIKATVWWGIFMGYITIWYLGLDSLDESLSQDCTFDGLIDEPMFLGFQVQFWPWIFRSNLVELVLDSPFYAVASPKEHATSLHLGKFQEPYRSLATMASPWDPWCH